MICNGYNKEKEIASFEKNKVVLLAVAHTHVYIHIIQSLTHPFAVKWLIGCASVPQTKQTVVCATHTYNEHTEWLI